MSFQSPRPLRVGALLLGPSPGVVSPFCLFSFFGIPFFVPSVPSSSQTPYPTPWPVLCPHISRLPAQSPRHHTFPSVSQLFQFSRRLKTLSAMLLVLPLPSYLLTSPPHHSFHQYLCSFSSFALFRLSCPFLFSRIRISFVCLQPPPPIFFNSVYLRCFNSHGLQNYSALTLSSSHA